MRPHPKVLIDRAVGLYGMDEVVHWAASLLAASFESPREADEAAAAIRRMEQRLDRRLRSPTDGDCGDRQR